MKPYVYLLDKEVKMCYGKCPSNGVPPSPRTEKWNWENDPSVLSIWIVGNTSPCRPAIYWSLCLSLPCCCLLGRYLFKYALQTATHRPSKPPYKSAKLPSSGSVFNWPLSHPHTSQLLPIAMTSFPGHIHWSSQ